MEDNT